MRVGVASVGQRIPAVTVLVLLAISFTLNFAPRAEACSNCVVAQIRVGDHPLGGAYDPTNGEVYVTNAYEHNVSVINSTSLALVKNITVGTEPFGAVYAPSDGDVYVSNLGSNTVSVIDPSTNTVKANVTLGSPYSGVAPYGLAYASSNGYVYVADYGAGNVTAIDTATNEVVKNISLGNANSAPVSLVFSPSNGDLYVAEYGANATAVISTSTNAVAHAPIPVGGNPSGTAYNPVSGYVYVTNFGSGSVSIIDPSTNSVVRTVAVGVQPWGVAADPGPDPGNMFVTDFSTGQIYMLNASLQDVLLVVALGSDGPDDIVVIPVAPGPSAPPGTVELMVANYGSYDETVLFIQTIPGGTTTSTTSTGSGTMTTTPSATSSASGTTSPTSTATSATSGTTTSAPSSSSTSATSSSQTSELGGAGGGTPLAYYAIPIVILVVLGLLYTTGRIPIGKKPPQVPPVVRPAAAAAAKKVRATSTTYEASMHSDATGHTGGAGHAWPDLRVTTTVTEDGVVVSTEVTEYDYDFAPEGSNVFYTNGEVVASKKTTRTGEAAKGEEGGDGGGGGGGTPPVTSDANAYFPITEDGFNAAKAWAESTVTRDGGRGRKPPGKPPNYKVLSYNCVDYTVELCKRAGVDVSSFEVSGWPSTPSDLVSKIRQKNCKHEWEEHTVYHIGTGDAPPIPPTKIWVCKLCGATRPA
jgi:YVTN family beta-propeller protein